MRVISVPVSLSAMTLLAVEMNRPEFRFPDVFFLLIALIWLPDFLVAPYLVWHIPLFFLAPGWRY